MLCRIPRAGIFKQRWRGFHLCLNIPARASCQGRIERGGHDRAVAEDLRLAIRAGGGFGLGRACLLPDRRDAGALRGRPRAGVLARIAPGILWSGFWPTCCRSAGSSRSISRMDRLIFWRPRLSLWRVSDDDQAVAHWLTTGLPLVLAAPVFGVLLHLEGSAYFWLVLSLALGTPALSVLGAFGAALTVGLKRGGLLLSLLVLPLYVPTLIFGAELVRRGASGMETQVPLLMLAGITAACIAVVPFASAAAIRVNLR
ncbi:MAG: heme exporter protein CcmB [Paracoccaceae bacterium]